jgi:peptidoglycan/LPS O-acetylase OafA/YrhL
LIFRRIKIPGAAFIASIAYSAYLIQKLVIRAVEQFCSSHNIQPTSALALVGVELCVYAAATLLFLLVERPFLQLRKRLTPRRSGNQLHPRRQEVARDKPHTS